MTMTMTLPAMSNEPTYTTVEVLDRFLRGELAAADRYEQAMDALSQPARRAILQQCGASHRRRADLLEEEIRRRGCVPSDSAGPWGVLTMMVEGGAAMLGEQSAVAALRRGERFGVRQYHRDITRLESAARQLVIRQLIPEQHRTADAVDRLWYKIARPDNSA